eukprot:5236310-Lingulodinium_polyedra.AAC.1
MRAPFVGARVECVFWRCRAFVRLYSADATARVPGYAFQSRKRAVASVVRCCASACHHQAFVPRARHYFRACVACVFGVVARVERTL